MAFVEVPGHPIPIPNVWGEAANPPLWTNRTLDADGEKLAFVLQAPKTGTINKVAFRVESLTQAPTNGLRVSLQNVSTSDGNPDGTQDQYRNVPVGDLSAATCTETGLLTDDGTDGGVKRSVTAGDYFAVVIEFESFVASDNLALTAYENSLGAIPRTNGYSMYSSHYTTSWSKNSGFLQIAVNMTVGGVTSWVPIIGSGLWESFNTGNISSTSTPDTVGSIFTLPIPMRAVGIRRWGNNGNFAADFTLRLYDASNTVLGSAVKDATLTVAQGVQGWEDYYFAEGAVELAADTTYRVAAEFTVSTGAADYYFNYPSITGIEDGSIAGSTWYRTSRKDDGAWTDDTGSWTPIGILVDALDPVKTTGSQQNVQQNFAAVFSGRHRIVRGR